MDARMEKLEQAFKAIADVWCETQPTESVGPAAQPSPPSVEDEDPAEASFLAKLQAFAGTLDPAEQEYFTGIMSGALETAGREARTAETEEERATGVYLEKLQETLVSPPEALPIGPIINVTIVATKPLVGALRSRIIRRRCRRR